MNFGFLCGKVQGFFFLVWKNICEKKISDFKNNVEIRYLNAKLVKIRESATVVKENFEIRFLEFRNFIQTIYNDFPGIYNYIENYTKNNKSYKPKIENLTISHNLIKINNNNSHLT